MPDQYQLKNIYENLLRITNLLVSWDVIEEKDRPEIIKYYNQCPDDKKEQYVASIFEIGKEKSTENYELIRHLDYYFDTKEILDGLPNEQTLEQNKRELVQLEQEKTQLDREEYEATQKFENIDRQYQNEQLLSKIPSSNDRKALSLEELLNPSMPRTLYNVSNTSFENSSSMAGNMQNINVPVFSMSQNTQTQNPQPYNQQTNSPTPQPQVQSSGFQPINITNPVQVLSQSNKNPLLKPWNPNMGVVRPVSQNQNSQNNPNR